MRMKKYWAFWLAAVVGMVNKQTLLEIKYKDEEIKVLKEIILRDRKRIPLNNNQRRRLAVLAKELGRATLFKIGSIFEPDTILGWNRKHVAKKYDGSANRKGGKPKVRQEVIDIVLRLARENTKWGFGRIRNFADYLGFTVSKSTVKRILEDNGYDSNPNNEPTGTWRLFIDSHIDVICATDFLTVELRTPFGVVRCMVLFVIEYSRRKVYIAGIKINPDGEWMKQIARNLTDCENGFLKGKRYLIHDRDPLFTKEFDEILKAGGVKAVKTVAKSPNLNSVAERWILSFQVEALNHLILTSQKQLEYVAAEYETYYNRERCHSYLGGEMIDPWPQDEDGEIVCYERLGGLLKTYRRVNKAA